MKKSCLIFFAILSLFAVTQSCKKSDLAKSPITDSATIMGFEDSTQLIKTIHQDFFDSASAMITDSSTGIVYYDTVGKKITIISNGSSSGQAYSEQEVIYYTNNGLLSKWTISSPTQQSSDIASATYTYDAANVLNGYGVTFVDGSSYTIPISKSTLISGDYQLSWVDTSGGYYDSNNVYHAEAVGYSVNFDNTGKLLSYSQPYYSDTAIYDATGNISKITESAYEDSNRLDSAVTYDLYDFVTRDNKGNQLYNFFQIAWNGISQIPGDFIIGGITTEYMFQNTKFPALSTNISRPSDGDYCYGCGIYMLNFNSSPQYDSQGRLVKYRMFFDDVHLDYEDYTITYYK